MLKNCMLRDSDKYIEKGYLVIDITRTAGHILSPFWNTINNFKRETESIGKEAAWENFIPDYLNDINTIGADREIKSIINLVEIYDKQNLHVYLACYCNTSKFCHRFLLFDKIDKLIVNRQKSLDDY